MRGMPTNGEGIGMLIDLFRVTAHYEATGRAVPDPETYWVNGDEAATLLDALLTVTARRERPPFLVRVEVTPFEQLELF